MLKSSLYYIPEETFTPVQKPSSTASVAVFLSQDDYTQESTELLSKILGAAHLNLEKDCFLCTLSPDTTAHYYKGMDLKNVSKIIVFGLSPDNLSIHIKSNLYTTFELDGKSWFFAHSLQQFVLEKQQGGKQKRLALWNVLKKLFNI